MNCTVIVGAGSGGMQTTKRCCLAEALGKHTEVVCYLGVEEGTELLRPPQNISA